MEEAALHLEVRNAIALSDELRRHEHALGNDILAGHLAAVKTSLGELEREVGRSHERHRWPLPTLVESIGRSLALLRDRAEEIPLMLRPRFVQLLSTLERVMYAELRPGAPVPAKSIAGSLPVKRVVPQLTHSIVDYVAAGAYLASAALARTRRARTVGTLLGGGFGALSALTDDRLSACRLISIENHEVADHAAGIVAATAPLVLGYWKRDPIASSIQMVTGLATIAIALLTDFRAERGIGPARRSRGGPKKKSSS